MKIQISKSGSVKAAIADLQESIEELISSDKQKAEYLDKAILNYVLLASFAELKNESKSIIGSAVIEDSLAIHDANSLAEKGFPDSEIRKLEKLGWI